MRIRKLDTANKEDVRQFIECPFPIYAGNKQRVPAVEPEIKLVLNREKHPYYQHSVAEFFVAEQDGDTLGRICVLDNTAYNAHHGTRAAFFYYYDTAPVGREEVILSTNFGVNAAAGDRLKTISARLTPLW